MLRWQGWVLESQGITDDWVAARDWVCPDGTVDIDFMDEHFGKSVVTTVDTSRCAVTDVNAQVAPLCKHTHHRQQHTCD